MRLRRALLGAAGLLGTAAVGNAALRRRAGPLTSPLEGEPRSYRWRGMDVAYTEAGDTDDPTILFLHGVDLTASSAEFDEPFGALSAEYHVVAPDLPGFGCSDRPPIEYDDGLYVDFVREFAADVTPGATCVASSLSGSFAALAQRETGVFSDLVLVCPTGTTRAIRRPLRRRFVDLPVLGTAAFNLLASRPAIERRARVASSGERPDDADVEYRWRSAHQPGARHAPAAFLSGALDPVVSLTAVLEDVDGEVTLVWGSEARDVTISYGRDLAASADARLVVFDRAGSQPHVQFPEAFTDVIRETLASEERPSEQLR